VISGLYTATDLGNAARFARDHQGHVRYVHGIGWHTWDAMRWATDRTGEVERLARDTVRAITNEITEHTDSKERTELLRWAAASEARARIEAMLKLAESELGLAAVPESFDRERMVFNTLSGVVDLLTGLRTPHDPSQQLTKVAHSFLNPEVPCPTWLSFLDRIMGGDLEKVEFLQRAIGYSLTGDTSEQCVFMAYGTGANGKSTLLEVLRSILGDYAMHTPAETLLSKGNGAGIPNDIARLRGARFVTAVETDDGRRMAEPLVKMLSGSDTITARFLHREFFEFKPTFKVWLATNHKPVIRGTDWAIWRRIRLVPFTVTIPEAERDKHLTEKLLREAPGILAWAVDGCREWQRIGLAEPESVKAATEGYRDEMDPLSDWIEERCVVAPQLQGIGLYTDYSTWAKGNGRTPLDGRAFSQQLERRGFTRERRGGQTYFDGIGIAAAATAERYPRAVQ
jgi:putative DNA primase/helicase